MRILLNLKPHETYTQNFNYHYKAQGFVYQLLMNTKFAKLHDKPGYKFFCFSNIFQSKSSHDKSWKFIISSPNEKFIKQVAFSLQKVQEINVPVQLGQFFELESFETLNSLSTDNLITGTPITVRINKERFEKVTNTKSQFDEVYWRREHPLELFIDSVEENLKQKYKEFTKSEINSRIIENFEFKKQVSTKVRMGRIGLIPVIGTMWKFKLSPKLTEEQRIFCIESGFGERNSMGFGFMNSGG